LSIAFHEKTGAFSASRLGRWSAPAFAAASSAYKGATRPRTPRWPRHARSHVSQGVCPYQAPGRPASLTHGKRNDCGSRDRRRTRRGWRSPRGGGGAARGGPRAGRAGPRWRSARGRRCRGRRYSTRLLSQGRDGTGPGRAPERPEYRSPIDEYPLTAAPSPRPEPERRCSLKAPLRVGPNTPLRG
jgi:hypothetical protein